MGYRERETVEEGNQTPLRARRVHPAGPPLHYLINAPLSIMSPTLFFLLPTASISILHLSPISFLSIYASFFSVHFPICIPGYLYPTYSFRPSSHSHPILPNQTTNQPITQSTKPTNQSNTHPTNQPTS